MAYRPQSPDLSGYQAPNQPGFTNFARQDQPIFGNFPTPAQRLSTQYGSNPGNIASPTSVQSPLQYQNPPYNAYTSPIKAETVDSKPYNEINMATQTVSDPTHGVVLKTSFPVARIKRIMQADEDIGKVAQVTPHVVSRALELFMIKLITASSEQAKGPGVSKGPRRVLAQHMKRAIQADETFDFLADIISRVPDAPAKAKKEANSDSEDAKPRKKGKKRKESTDDY